VISGRTPCCGKKDTRHETIEELGDLLKHDMSLPHPKFPKQSFFALKDERVAKPIRHRLENGRTLTAVNILEYDFFGGLNRIYFEFAPPQPLGIKPSAILVVMDGACNVVGVVEPFDPAQPNPVLPTLPEKSEQASGRGELPFVLVRPSDSKNLPFTEVDLYMLQVRYRHFFRQIGGGGLGGGLGGLTGCDSPASTLSGVVILAVPQNYDEPVVVTDTVNDDTCPPA
jgi:hypothetical protein